MKRSNKVFRLMPTSALTKRELPELGWRREEKRNQVMMMMLLSSDFFKGVLLIGSCIAEVTSCSIGCVIDIAWYVLPCGVGDPSILLKQNFRYYCVYHC